MSEMFGYNPEESDDEASYSIQAEGTYEKNRVDLTQEEQAKIRSRGLVFSTYYLDPDDGLPIMYVAEVLPDSPAETLADTLTRNTSVLPGDFCRTLWVEFMYSACVLDDDDFTLYWYEAIYNDSVPASVTLPDSYPDFEQVEIV